MAVNISGVIEFADLLELLELRHALQPTLQAQWRTVRAALVADFGPRHAQQIRAKLDALHPGLATALDERVGDIKKAQKVLADLPRPANGGDPEWRLFLTYVYWRHSQDATDAKAALSWTSIERQYARVYAWDLEPCEFDWACPSCGATSKGLAGTCAPDPEKRAGFAALKCHACGHSERFGIGLESSGDAPPVLECECAGCIRRRARIHELLAALPRSLTPRLIAKVRHEVQDLRRFLSSSTTAKPSPRALDFCRFAWNRPDLSLGELLLQSKDRGLWHPAAFESSALPLLRELYMAGAVTVEFDTIDLSDKQAVLEETLCSRDPHDEVERANLARHVTAFLRGPRSNSGKDLAAYLATLDAMGLERSWFRLPCDCMWEIDRDAMGRLLRQAGDEPQRGLRPEKRHLYSISSQFGEHGEQERISRLFAAIDPVFRPALLAQIEEVKKAAAPCVSQRCEDLLSALGPELREQLRDIERRVRAQDQSFLDIRAPHGEELATLLYFRLCREVVPGSVVPRAWIMRAFGVQNAQFQRLLQPLNGVSAECPTCASTGEINALQFGVEKLTGGRFTCSACGHVEVFDARSRTYDRMRLDVAPEELVGLPGRLGCPCQACVALRESIVRTIAQTAEGLADAFHASMLACIDAPEIGWKHYSRSMPEDAAAGYCMLRLEGHSSAEAASLLFDHTESAFGDGTATPGWLQALVAVGVFKLGAEQRLSSEAARVFLDAHLFSGQPKLQSMRDVEEALKSRDFPAVCEALTALSTDRCIPLARRWEATEDLAQIELRGANALRDGRRPKQKVPEPDRISKLDAAWRIAEGGITRGGQAAPQEVQAASDPDPAEKDAIALLARRGYTILPPRAQ